MTEGRGGPDDDGAARPDDDEAPLSGGVEAPRSDDDEAPRSGGDEPGLTAAPPEPPAADPADGAEPAAAEALSEPPTIGWVTGVGWEPATPEPAVLPPAGVKLQVGSVLGRTLDTFVRRWT